MARKSLNDTPLERTVQNACIRIAKAYGAVVVNQHGGPTSERGVSDLLLCYRGTFIACEVKRDHPASKTDGFQDRFLARVRAAGGVAIVARRGEDLEAVFIELDALKGAR